MQHPLYTRILPCWEPLYRQSLKKQEKYTFVSQNPCYLPYFVLNQQQSYGILLDELLKMGVIYPLKKVG